MIVLPPTGLRGLACVGVLSATISCGFASSSNAKDYAVFSHVASSCLTTDLSLEELSPDKSIGSEALALLLPGVIKPLLTSVGTLIENIGAEQARWTRSHSTSQYFYTSQSNTQATDFKLELSKRARCLTIVAGEIDSLKDDDKIQDSAFFKDSKVLPQFTNTSELSLADYLQTTYNFTNRPFAYLEFELSPQSSAPEANLAAIEPVSVANVTPAENTGSKNSEAFPVKAYPFP